MTTATYKTITKEESLKFYDLIDILLLTATPIETTCLHEQLEPIEETILKVGIDNYTYFIGKFGNYLVAHVQCKAGSASSSGSSVVVSHAINIIKPKAVIMVGIAFGLDKVKQKIGDILVSESIAPYDIKRLGEKQSIQRGGTPKASIFLTNRFQHHKWSYSYKLTDKGQFLQSNTIFGLLLTGEKLIDNVEERNKLQLIFSEAIGGEMEGIGLSSSAESARIDWIIVKGICDFADGNKNKNKKLFQKIAATAAVDYCKSIFYEKHVFSELGIKEYLKIQSLDKPRDINGVLFRTYSTAVEPFYITREIDDTFNNYLLNYSIWLHGLSGCGKSSIILRNLLKSGFDIIQICLAAGNDYDLKSILIDILTNLKMYFQIEHLNNLIRTEDELIQDISILIASRFKFGHHIIYLDEIPEYNDKEVFNLFFKSLYAINANIRVNNPDVDFIFVLSSITSPRDYLHISQHKILESFKIISLEKWSDDDSKKLIRMINSELDLSLDEKTIDEIKVASSSLPRNIKIIIRDYLSTLGLPNYSLDRIMLEMKEQLK